MREAILAGSSGAAADSACSTPSGSCLPLSANSGTVRHTSMVTAQHANTTRKSPHPIGSISLAPSPR